MYNGHDSDRAACAIAYEVLMRTILVGYCITTGEYVRCEHYEYQRWWHNTVDEYCLVTDIKTEVNKNAERRYAVNDSPY